MTAQQFTSLTHLQSAHAALVRKVGRDLLHNTSQEQITAFVLAAVATGAILETKDERAAAQGLIGYWTARVTAAIRESARAANRSGEENGREVSDPLADIDTLLAPFVAKTVGEATASANAWIDTQSEESDRALVRRILLRMVRLAVDGKPILMPVRRESLDDLEPRERVDMVLAELEKSGVVRRSTRPDGTEEFGLRASELLTEWPFLRIAITRRVEFRQQADKWTTAGEPSSRGGKLLTAVRRILLRVGNCWNTASGWLVQRVRYSEQLYKDPAIDLPDVDFYRDRTQAEVRYLFARRAQAKEREEWRRLMQGLVLVGLMAGALLTTAVIVVGVMRSDAALEAQQKRLANEELARVKQELHTRRARQRLKEHIILVRLLAQHQQFNNPRDYPRAEVAKWRIESPVTGELKELEMLKREWRQIGIKLETDKDNPEKDNICAECTGSPLDVARKLREELLYPRLTEGNDAYDSDTVAYHQSLVREWYDAAGKLADAICSVFDTLGTDDRPHSFIAAAGYMDEFWVLYFGEMVIVESPEVERAMVAFGDALKRVDTVFAEEVDRRMGAIKGAKKRPDKRPDWNVVTNSYLWSSAENNKELVAKRAEFLQQRVADLRSTLPAEQKQKAADAIEELKQRRSTLRTVLKAEMANLRTPTLPTEKK